MSPPKSKETSPRDSEEYDDGYDEMTCPNTGMDRNKCQCLECIPHIFRFKWICAEAKTIDDVVKTLGGVAEYFKGLKREGWTVDGSIPDDYMELCPPVKEGYYWTRCGECGAPFTVQDRAVSPGLCDRCDLAQDNARTSGRNTRKSGKVMHRRRAQ